MPKNQTKEFLKRKAMVEQALRSEKKRLVEDYDGMATIRMLIDRTGLNQQAVKRIVNNLEKEGRVKVIMDKSHIVLLKKDGK